MKIVSPEDWDGDFWESPDENADEGEWNSDETTEPPPLREKEVPDLKMRHKIKTSVQTTPRWSEEEHRQNYALGPPATGKSTGKNMEENQGSQKLSICGE